MEQLLKSLLETSEGRSVVALIVAYWTLRKVDGWLGSDGVSLDKRDKDTGLTEREKMLLEIERLKWQGITAQTALNWQRRLHEVEVQMVALGVEMLPEIVLVATEGDTLPEIVLGDGGDDAELDGETV